MEIDSIYNNEKTKPATKINLQKLTIPNIHNYRKLNNLKIVLMIVIYLRRSCWRRLGCMRLNKL
jgi:hypothetical protein